ncbi:peptidylprolyl isomerase [Daejeonella oryzae]|uniref:peptidylprolyl isomerase n=1 Tax=Daejeonella oryzae TaxID=1122943 RepID=UPI00047AC2FE|nr:peptidylprolyl isomerase [Daejeonella oryzae]
MRKPFLAFFILCSISSIQAQTLVKLGSKEVTVQEFLWVYNKSNGTPPAFDEKSLKSYLDLYSNFRLKVIDAEAHGLDQEEGFKQELDGYRAKLAERYLLEREVSDKLIVEAYERSQKIINASHILVLCAPQATPADTLIAYNKIRDIKDQALNGSSFEELASRYSEEPGAAGSKGSVGNFTAFQMLYPFETAAYTTPKGKISSIVRTRFGYHIIKINDVLPNPGQREVAHIMVAVAPNSSYADSVLARNKIFEIHKRLNSGEDFSSMAKQYSDDKNSGLKGGLLPILSLGQSVKQFENTAFTLVSEGDISNPVQSNYGWHIIKLIQKFPLPPLEQVRNILKNRVTADERSALSQDLFISRLKKEYRLQENSDYKSEEALTKLLNDPEKYSNAVLFTVNKEKVLLPALAKYIQERRQIEGPLAKTSADWYQDFMNHKLIALENNHLEAHYPDFRFLMNEYRNGILLYNYSERKIWDLSQTDTAGLKAFFESHRQNYMWKERASANIYVTGSAKLLAETKQMLKQNIPEQEILQKLNQSNPLNLVINKGVYERSEHMFADRATWKSNTDSEIIVGNVHVLVQIHEVFPSRQKTFDEVRGLVLSDYQNFLEEEWIKQLKQKYPVVVNRSELKRLIR